MTGAPLSDMVGICILASVSIVSGHIVPGNRHILDGGASVSGVKHDTPLDMFKRAVVGESIKRILNGAKALYSNGLDVYYVKKGGYATAIDDFRSLQPEIFQVKGSPENIVYMKGNVGKWQVNFRRDKTTDSSIITMGLPKRAGQNGNLRIDSDLIGDKVVIYPD